MLEFGDRVGVMARRDQRDVVRAHFGDSIKGTTEFSYVSLGVGMALGVILGILPIPVPGLGTLKLGVAGGPLVMALILCRLGRTGSWDEGPDRPGDAGGDGMTLSHYRLKPAASLSTEADIGRRRGHPPIPARKSRTSDVYRPGKRVSKSSQVFASRPSPRQGAEQIDPLSLLIVSGSVWALVFAGRSDEAVAQIYRTPALDADFPDALGMPAHVH